MPNRAFAVAMAADGASLTTSKTRVCSARAPNVDRGAGLAMHSVYPSVS